MTPKLKAENLVEKLHKEIDSFYSGYWEVAKAQAIICVNEIIKANSFIDWENEDDIDFSQFFNYWEEVKQEIERL